MITSSSLPVSFSMGQDAVWQEEGWGHGKPYDGPAVTRRREGGGKEGTITYS